MKESRAKAEKIYRELEEAGGREEGRGYSISTGPGGGVYEGL